MKIFDYRLDGLRRPSWASALAAASVVALLACGDGTTDPQPSDAPRAATVAVRPAEAGLTALRETVRFTAEVRDQNGQAMAGAEVTWASGDVSVATVDPSGLATAAGNGTATITASAGSATGTATIMVRQVAVSVAIQPDTASLVAGHTLQLSARALDANDFPVYGPVGSEFTWSSSDTSVATVDAAGRVKALRAGGVAVTAMSGAVSGTMELTVASAVPSEIVVTPARLPLAAVGDTARIGAEVFDQAGGAMEGVEVAWSSSDPSVAAVEGDGLVRAVAAGEAAVNARAGDAEGGTEIRVGGSWDREALEAFYHSTGGPDWTNNDNWLTDAPLGEWHGVWTDASERVVILDMFGRGNNLVGPIPPEIGNLTALERLYLAWNDLGGPIPPEIGNLTALESLNLVGNDLSGRIPPEIGDLAALEYLQLYGNDLSGRIPPEIGNLAALEYLELAWNDLSGRIPPEIGDLAALEYLGLAWNDLSGRIPPEIGDLAALEYLGLYSNGTLSGPIPPEIGNLTALETLELYGNDFSGPIPAEVGNLSRLEMLGLGFNDFSGPIPQWIGRLTALKELDLRRNRFSGLLPPQIGELARLETLNLPMNDLSGPVPPEIGGLAGLTWLNLTGNDLSGPVPPELAGSASLKVVSFNNNPGMAGALPAGLTALRELEVLQASGTGLCAPSNPGFLAWLEGIGSRRIRPCVEERLAAYLTQAVQSREFPVPLVAGRRALLRVFPTARTATSAGIPPVRASFWVDGRERHVVNIPGSSTRIPTAVDEASLFKSANAAIPDHVLQPGLEMVIEIDPQGTLDSSLLVAKRIPEDGRLKVDVRAMPTLGLTVIPFVWSKNPDRSIVSLVRDMASDPGNHEMLWATRTLLPVGALDVTAHEPVLTSTNDAFELHSETHAIRTMEGGTNRYLGMMAGSVTGGVAGLASGADVSFAITDPGVIAHELGHNMSFDHAPCGSAAGIDPFYPHSDGSIGAWGYDFRDDGLVAPSTPDVMSYCYPEWISDYHFTKALHWRVREEENALGARTQAGRALLLWGGVGPDGLPFLEPAFVVDAPATLPNSTGQHRILGRGSNGGELFSLGFAMPEVADGDGRSSFAFVVPIRPGWEALASITLSGPGGSATLDGDTARPMAILRDPRTGQVRGFLRDSPPPAQAAMDAAGQTGGPELEMLFSSGIPSAEAWRRWK